MLEQLLMAWEVWKGQVYYWRRVKQHEIQKTNLIRAKYQLCCHDGLSQIDIQTNYAKIFCHDPWRDG